MSRFQRQIILAIIVCALLTLLMAASCGRLALNAKIVLFGEPTVGECDLETCSCQVTARFKVNVKLIGFNWDTDILMKWKVTNLALERREDLETDDDYVYQFSCTVEPGTYHFEFSGEIDSTKDLETDRVFFTVVCECEGCTLHPLTLSANPPEGGTTTGTGNYYKNKEVTVRAIPSTNWFFVNWTGEFPSADAQFSFTMPDHDVQLTANFESSPANPPTIQLNPTKEPTPTADGEQTAFNLYATQPLTELQIVCNTFLRTIQSPDIKGTIQNPDSSTTYIYEENHRRVEGNNAYEITGKSVNGTSNTLQYNANRTVAQGFRNLGKKGLQYMIIDLGNNSKEGQQVSFLVIGTVPVEHKKIVEMNDQYQFIENTSAFVGNYTGLAEYCMGSYWLQSPAYLQIIDDQWKPAQKIDNVSGIQSLPGFIAFYESDAVQLAKNSVYGAHLSRHPYQNGVSFTSLSNNINGKIAGIVPYRYDPQTDSHTMCFIDLDSPSKAEFIGSNGIPTGINIPGPGSIEMREDPLPLFGIPAEYGTPTYISLYKQTDEMTQFIINFVTPGGEYWIKIFTDTGQLLYSFQTHTELSASVGERDEAFLYKTVVKTTPDEETQGSPLTYGNLYVLHTAAPGFEVWEPLNP
ncbi:MAG TPA: hypothetical protein PLP59_09965 [Thermotogota bacterium]|nr:hypothetical protein [Thermotogota bacterium]HQQ66591.1 hypothetical protein [Thermotogota bacterium]